MIYILRRDEAQCHQYDRYRKVVFPQGKLIFSLIVVKTFDELSMFWIQRESRPYENKSKALRKGSGFLENSTSSICLIITRRSLEDHCNLLRKNSTCNFFGNLNFLIFIMVLTPKNDQISNKKSLKKLKKVKPFPRKK